MGGTNCGGGRTHAPPVEAEETEGMKIKAKRTSVPLPLAAHREVKRRAAAADVTMPMWIAALVVFWLEHQYQPKRTK